MEKHPELDIYKAIRKNNLIVWGLIFSFALALLIISIMMYRIYRYQVNHILTLDKNGEVLPLTWVPRDENINIEIRHHLEMFLTCFYQYDRYNWKQQVDKALWLADESVEKLFLKREEEGWFNEVTNLGTSQRILLIPDSIKVYGHKEPFEFDVPLTLIIENASQRNIYHFRSRGQVITVNRNYPLNPHGLLITRYRETQKQLIKQE